jgi:hypothetical protein
MRKKAELNDDESRTKEEKRKKAVAMIMQDLKSDRGSQRLNKTPSEMRSERRIKKKVNKIDVDDTIQSNNNPRGTFAVGSSQKEAESSSIVETKEEVKDEGKEMIEEEEEEGEENIEYITYVPHPLDTSSVEITPEVADLLEIAAKNCHEVWAKSKMNAGYRYSNEDGIKKAMDKYNLEIKKNPDSIIVKPLLSSMLVPYDDLLEEHKNKNRDTVSNLPPPPQLHIPTTAYYYYFQNINI